MAAASMERGRRLCVWKKRPRGWKTNQIAHIVLMCVCIYIRMGVSTSPFDAIWLSRFTTVHPRLLLGVPRALQRAYNTVMKVAYCTDVEGNLDYFDIYVEISEGICYTKVDGKKRLDLVEGYVFVYGGDVGDKGVGSIRYDASRGNEYIMRYATRLYIYIYA